jgi:hypothetical protein
MCLYQLLFYLIAKKPAKCTHKPFYHNGTTELLKTLSCSTYIWLIFGNFVSNVGSKNVFNSV